MKLYYVLLSDTDLIKQNKNMCARKPTGASVIDTFASLT